LAMYPKMSPNVAQIASSPRGGVSATGEASPDKLGMRFSLLLEMKAG
jgi:hypothetical protein